MRFAVASIPPEAMRRSDPAGHRAARFLPAGLALQSGLAGLDFANAVPAEHPSRLRRVDYRSALWRCVTPSGRPNYGTGHGMTAKVLQLVNSAFFGLRRE